MPRDSDKNNDSRGRRDRPGRLRRQGPLRGGPRAGEEVRQARVCRQEGVQGDGERRPYAGKPDGAKSFGKKPYSAVESPMPASATAMTPRPRGDRPFGDRPPAPRSWRQRRSSPWRQAVQRRPPRDDGEKRSFKPREDRGGGEKRPYTPRGDRPNFNRDDRPPRSDRDDARPAGRFSDRKFGDKKPYTPREGGGEKRPYTPRGEGFRKDGDRPQGDRPFRPGRRAMAIVPVVIGRSENLAATGSFRAVRPTVARARILATVRPRGDSKAVAEARGSRRARLPSAPADGRAQFRQAAL